MIWGAGFTIGGATCYIGGMKNYIVSALVFLLLATVSLQAADLHLRGEYVTLKCVNESISDVLSQLGRYDVAVRMDPSTDRRISMDVKRMPLEIFLKQLAGNGSYVITWEEISSPLGTMEHLSELRLLGAGGDMDRLRPLETKAGKLKLVGSPPYVDGEVLIGLKKGVTARQFAQILEQIDGSVLEVLDSMGIYRVRVPPGTDIAALTKQLENNPLVLAEPNYAAFLPDPGNVSSSSSGESTTSVPAVSADGKSLLAVLDSGWTPASGYESMVASSYNAANPDQNAVDNQGHGTQMALIASGALAPDGTTINDTASPVVAIRAFDDDGTATSYGLMRAIDYAENAGSKVLSLSWGTEVDSGFMQGAITMAAGNDLLLIAAAGNEPTGQALYPAAYSEVMAVAALDSSGNYWSNSNYGSFVSLAAPGVASMPVGYNGDPGTYAGTSISTAYVAASAAEYRAQNPSATAAETAAAIYNSLSAATSSNYGKGLYDQAAKERLLNN